MKKLIFTLLLILPQLVFARTVLLVSDMDDTIKVSHVLDPDSAVGNAIAVKNAFMGMPELYQRLSRIEGATPIHYLSNAPRKIMIKSHRKFIRKNKFPRGELVLNSKLIDPEHKIKSLRKMIETFRPDEMILIGDNGEHDPEVYAQIRKEYPHIGGLTYIHLAYSKFGFEGSFGKPLLDNQIGWATSLDLALDLMFKGYIVMKDYLKVVKAVEERALAEKNDVERNRQMMFPAWFDCRDFTVPVLPGVSSELQTKIETRCASEPIED